MTEELIRCSQASCRALKPASDFVNAQTGLRTKLCLRCRSTARKSSKNRKDQWWPKRQAYNRLQAYGITEAEYQRLVTSQEGVCAICKRPPEEASIKGFNVDHDHSTGKVRGLLCQLCNDGLGKFQDDTQRLSAAIAYLREPPTSRIGFRDPIDL